MAMTRTADWIKERIIARIARQVPFTLDVREGDVILTHEDTGISEQFRVFAWGCKDNSDESVRKWVMIGVDRWIGKIAKRIAMQNATTEALRRQIELAPNAQVAAQVLPAPAPRRRGRPPKRRQPEPQAVVDEGDDVALEMQR